MKKVTGYTSTGILPGSATNLVLPSSLLSKYPHPSPPPGLFPFFLFLQRSVERIKFLLLLLLLFSFDYENRFVLLMISTSSPRPVPRSGELRTQKLKSHLVRTQSLNVLPFKPGVGQYIAIHATLTARDFFLAYFYPSGPLTCIFFPKPLPIFPVLAVANTWFLSRPAE